MASGSDWCTREYRTKEDIAGVGGRRRSRRMCGKRKEGGQEIGEGRMEESDCLEEGLWVLYGRLVGQPGAP